MKSSRSWKSSLPSVFFLCALIFTVYFAVVFFGFVLWDDDQNIILNPWVKGFWDSRYWTWAWTTRLLYVYQPISWLFFQAQYALAWDAPASFIHLISLLLHMANAIIVFVLCHVLVNPSRDGKGLAPLCGALYFALHPLQCEAVAWASCQPYLLASLWGGLSLLCFMKSLETSKGRFWYWVSAGFFAASLLSKSIFVSLPAILGILRFARARSRKFTLEIVWRDWLFWLCSLCAFMLALWARAGAPAKDAVRGLALLKVVPAFFGFFIEKTVFPLGLSPIYDLSHATSIAMFLGVLLLAVTFICLVNQKRQGVGLSLLVLIILLMPGLAAAITEGVLFGDRYAYLPNGVIALIISKAVCLLQKGTSRSALPAWLCAVLVSVGLAIPLRHQIALWSDSVRLWQQAVQFGAASSHKAYVNLGRALVERGRGDEAITHYRRALEIKPDCAEAYVNIGIVLAERGGSEEAIPLFQKALEIGPGLQGAHYNLGVALAERGRVDEAITHYERALQIQPDFGEARRNLEALLRRRP